VKSQVIIFLYLFPAVSSASAPLKQPTAKVESDSEEEIDFGFWEKAPDPQTPQLKQEQQRERTDMKEVDLNLL
jgi:hypothetical protein